MVTFYKPTKKVVAKTLALSKYKKQQMQSLN